VEGAIPVAIAVLCSDLPSLSAVRAAAKQWALSAAVSQSLSVWICEQRLTRTASGRELAPIVFGFDPEAARKGLGGPAVARSLAVTRPPPAPRGRGGDGYAHPATAFPLVRVRRRPVGR
jgi:hypothetical protein